MIKGLVDKLWFGFFTLVLGLGLASVGIYVYLKDEIPQLPDDLANINLSLPTEVYSADGEILKTLGQRHPVEFEEISPNFVKAIVAVEDSRFYEHAGLDHIGLVRATYRNILAGRVVQGGSTITQQLSKNLFFSFEKRWQRKVKELLVALQMEAVFEKNEILAAYSNQVYFGSAAYGVEEAALTYFGKRARDLTLLQAALLAGLPNSPNNANPFNNLPRAMKRTEYVLSRMVKLKMISAYDAKEALADDLKLVTPKEETDPNLYFVNYVLDRLEENYGKEFIYFGGLKIITTLDTRLQHVAHKAVDTHLRSLDKLMREREGGRPLEASLVSLENKTGAVRVLLGGRRFSQSQFNRAVSGNRLPGSSFKPFVYFTAMETLGMSPASVVVDEPVIIEIPGTMPWEPKNFDEGYEGEIILKKALMKSLNVVSAKLIYEVTPDRVIKTARQFGITSPLGRHMSLALGTSGISPLELAKSYSVIANLGVLNQPYLIQKIEDFRGKPLYEHFYHGVQRVSPKAVYPLLDMMQGVVDGGTGRVIRRLGFKHPAGGKTGTTNDFKDAWFNGFTKDYTTSVWVGYDNNDSMIKKDNKGVTGGQGAAPIWAYFMQKALQGKSPVQFPVPEGIKFVSVGTHTGLEAEGRGSLKVAVKDEFEFPEPPSLEGIMENDLTEEIENKNKEPEKKNALPGF